MPEKIIIISESEAIAVPAQRANPAVEAQPIEPQIPEPTVGYLVVNENCDLTQTPAEGWVNLPVRHVTAAEKALLKRADKPLRQAIEQAVKAQRNALTDARGRLAGFAAMTPHEPSGKQIWRAVTTYTLVGDGERD